MNCWQMPCIWIPQPKEEKVMFKSEKQKKYLFANEPEIAKRWAKNYKHGGFVIVKPRGFGRMLPNKRPKTKIYT